MKTFTLFSCNPAATSVTWFVQNGPVWNIALNGLASTAPVPGRTYTLRESLNLIAPFGSIGSFSVSSEETNKLVQDTAAPAGRNFYQIEIAKP